MRSFLLFLGVLASFCFGSRLSAQVAISINSSCSAITVVQDDLYDQNIYARPWHSFGLANPNNTCALIVFNPGTPAPPRYSLEKQQPNGSFTKISGPQLGKTFSVSSNGVYRVRAEYPRPIQVNNCVNTNFRVAVNTNLQPIGFIGAYAPLLSNLLYVGPADNSLVNISFDNDANIQAAYPLSVPVILNTTGSSPFLIRWKMYVWEVGNWQNRYESPFFNGALPSTINIPQRIIDNSNVGPYTWQGFQASKNYKVHIGVQTPCGGWGFQELQWFVCPPTIICRPDVTAQTLRITPNPVVNYFSLIGDQSGQSAFNYTEDRLEIINLSGQLLKTMPLAPMGRYDLSDLPKGMYILRVLNRENELIFKDKLVKM